MAVLRSARLFAVQTDGPAVSAFLFACPPGHRAILRSVDIIAASGGGAGGLLSVAMYAGGATDFPFIWHTMTADLSQYQWRGQFVLDEGEELLATGSGQLTTWSGSGALLPLL